MEVFYAILGLVMFYAWIHGIIIVGKKVKDTTQYENVVLIVCVITMVLYVIGTLMD